MIVGGINKLGIIRQGFFGLIAGNRGHIALVVQAEHLKAVSGTERCHKGLNAHVLAVGNQQIVVANYALGGLGLRGASAGTSLTSGAFSAAASSFSDS